MENIIIIIIKALGVLGQTGVHWLLDKIEDAVIASGTLIDNELFYKAITYIQSWEPKNPPPTE